MYVILSIMFLLSIIHNVSRYNVNIMLGHNSQGILALISSGSIYMKKLMGPIRKIKTFFRSYTLTKLAFYFFYFF